MRKNLTLIFLLVLAINGFSQTEVSVETGASYANEVYYSFDDSVLQTSPRADWDIAFTTQRMSISILANTGKGLNLYTYTNGSIDDWAAVDTTGMQWNPMYNSIESWDDGAFSANTDTSSAFDFGWGTYNMSNHHVTGDSLYIVEISDTAYKKLAIVDRDAPNNKFIFKYADLDGSNEVTDTVSADDYSTSFVHYSFEQDAFVAQEPEERWQLLFTRYFDYNIPYYVTGVLANTGVSVQEVNGVTQADFEDYDMELFSDTISQIGSDWKSFNMGTFTYDVASDVVYFVQDTLDGKETHPIWKLYFTAFGGSTNGKYTFIQKELAPPTGIELTTIKNNVTVYPNPVSNQLNIIHDFTGEVEYSVYNMAGKMVLKETRVETNSLNNRRFNVDYLPNGIYNVAIRSGKELVTTKFLKQ